MQRSERRYDLAPVATRSRLMLEVASEPVRRSGWPHRQARIRLRNRASETWSLTLFASDSPEGGAGRDPRSVELRPAEDGLVHILDRDDAGVSVG